LVKKLFKSGQTKQAVLQAVVKTGSKRGKVAEPEKIKCVFSDNSGV